jgi:hypothetical protein
MKAAQSVLYPLVLSGWAVTGFPAASAVKASRKWGFEEVPLAASDAIRSNVHLFTRWQDWWVIFLAMLQVTSVASTFSRFWATSVHPYRQVTFLKCLPLLLPFCLCLRSYFRFANWVAVFMPRLSIPAIWQTHFSFEILLTQQKYPWNEITADTFLIT